MILVSKIKKLFLKVIYIVYINLNFILYILKINILKIKFDLYMVLEILTIKIVILKKYFKK